MAIYRGGRAVERDDSPNPREESSKEAVTNRKEIGGGWDTLRALTNRGP